MALIQNLEKMTAKEVLSLINSFPHSPETGPLEAAKAAIQTKLTDQMCGTIDTAGKEFKEMTGDLKGSIDQFRKSNEKTSNRLVWLTGVIGFSALVQAIYVATLLFKN